MSEILQIFSGNPLGTFVGKKIESATRPELDSDDWGLNIEICDIINENDDDAKDAVRAIRKRLQQVEQDRNFIITNRTLTVLETCVSNCSRRFHILVMTKDFIQDLVKLIGPKNNPPIDLQERVLRLIERWADAFKAQPDLGGVVAVYNELKSKGVTFPPRDPSTNVPIQTPQRSVPPPVASPINIAMAGVGSLEHGIPGPVQQSQPGAPVVLEGEGYNKISQDLGVVQTSIEMFNEIMGALEKKNEESDWQLAADLNVTCRQMKDRIVDLIERVANEDLTIELLRLNDDLLNVFVKYDRLVKNRTKVAGPANSSVSGATTSSSSVTKPPVRPSENELSLIDFNNEDNNQAEQLDPFDTSKILSSVAKPSITSGASQQTASLAQDLGRMGLGTDANAASSRTTTTKQTSSGLPEEISSVREQDFREIENWLSTDSGRDLHSIAGDMPSIEPISIPNSEFENFIASRALAGSKAPKSSSGNNDSTGDNNNKST